LLAYASGYLKAHYPAAFYTALLNNQPMGFYHASTLVKDAQRRGVRFHSIDVQVSGWDCTIEADGAIRLGLRYVNGLREQVGRAIANSRQSPTSSLQPPGFSPQPPASTVCPKCGCDDDSMLEWSGGRLFCNVCSHDSADTRQGGSRAVPAARFTSVDELVARTGLRRDELVTLADIGALNAFGYDRRAALWQAERAIRPAGELFENLQFTS